LKQGHTPEKAVVENIFFYCNKKIINNKTITHCHFVAESDGLFPPILRQFNFWIVRGVFQILECFRTTFSDGHQGQSLYVIPSRELTIVIGKFPEEVASLCGILIVAYLNGVLIKRIST
jgi:hypothetical protein